VVEANPLFVAVGGGKWEKAETESFSREPQKVSIKVGERGGDSPGRKCVRDVQAERIECNKGTGAVKKSRSCFFDEAAERELFKTSCASKELSPFAGEGEREKIKERPSAMPYTESKRRLKESCENSSPPHPPPPPRCSKQPRSSVASVEGVREMWRSRAPTALASEETRVVLPLEGGPTRRTGQQAETDLATW